MKKTTVFKTDGIGFEDSVYNYILLAAGMVLLYMAFPSFTRSIYEQCLIVPTMLFVGAMKNRRVDHNRKMHWILPGAMVAWFLILQVKREINNEGIDSIGLFLSTYLFAFPLASILQDGDKKKALKMFAGAYLAAAVLLSVHGLLLVLDRLPAGFSKYVYWDGSRLGVFWHPNIAACLLMVGIIFGTTFWTQAKTGWSKSGYAFLIVLMVVVQALTNCRTAIILTGGYLAAQVFFTIIKHGKKWILPGFLALAVLTVVFYLGCMQIYQANENAMIRKYTEQYAEQLTAGSVDSAGYDEEDYVVETTEPEDNLPAEDADAGSGAEETVKETEAMQEGIGEESYEEENYEEENYEEALDEDQGETIPIATDPYSGEVYLITESAQGSIEEDFGTLNSRTYIWSAARFAIRETPSILYWGMYNPGEYVSYYNFFPISHLHNAWMQCLVGMGAVGFLLSVVFTLITVWNCLIVLVKHYQDSWKRNVALLSACLLVAAILEPYLFYTTRDYHLVDFLFFLCSGYLLHWQEKDNCRIIEKIRSWIVPSKE